MSKIIINMSKTRENTIGVPLEIEVIFPNEMQVDKVTAYFNYEGQSTNIVQEFKKMEENIFKGELTFYEIGKIYFHFAVMVNGEYKTLKNNPQSGEPMLSYPQEHYPYWPILITNQISETATQMHDKIGYQLFVDRFCRESEYEEKNPNRNVNIWGNIPYWQEDINGMFHCNDFYGGNLKGIKSKLEYIKSLGVDIVYMSPINLSNLRYDRYASSDHFKIDPAVGTFEDLAELYEETKRLDMKLVLDIALNHCHSDNHIFKEALNDPNSQYRDWFYFDNHNNYSYWFGMFKDMPIFNQYSEGLQSYIYGENSVISLFANYVDGFRLDVAEELKDFFLIGIKQRAEMYKKFIVYGEYWHVPSLSILGKGLDSFTNYVYSNAILKYIVFGDYQFLKGKVNELQYTLPFAVLNSSFISLDTHDTMRVLTLLTPKFIKLLRESPYDFIWDIDKAMSTWHKYINGNLFFDTYAFRLFASQNMQIEKEQYMQAVQKLKIAALIQYFLPGVPCIYYGTEAGVVGFKDPFNRTCYPWGNEDNDLIKFYSKLGAFRKTFKSDMCKIEFLESYNNIIVFKRFNKYNTVIVAINRSEEIVDINLTKYIDDNKEYIIFSINESTEKKLNSFGGISIILKDK